jgi:acyl carrier protein
MVNNDLIRQVLREHGRLSVPVDQIADSDDLYLAGMTSLASVNVMLALEAALDVEFPDEALGKATFASIAAISSALAEASRAPLS